MGAPGRRVVVAPDPADGVYGGILGAIAIACGLGAYETRGHPLAIPFAWLLAWFCAAFGVVAAAYALRRPGVFGKRADGGFPIAWRIFLAPVTIFAEACFHAYRVTLADRERDFDEVAPGIWVGRWIHLGALPDGVAHVVDATAEMRVRGALGARSYVAIPTLDATAPDAEAIARIVARFSGDAAEKGGIYVHCAFGHGRSAAIAAALLLARGHATTVEEAEARMKKARPRIGLNSAQKTAALAGSLGPRFRSRSPA